MNHTKMEDRLKKKVTLGGKALDQVLAPDDLALVSFWSQLENRATDRKARYKKEHAGKDDLPIDPAVDAQIDQEIEAEGQAILAKHNGSARAALDSLL